jgi:hypothetical protein
MTARRIRAKRSHSFAIQRQCAHSSEDFSTESVASPYTAEFRLGFGELGFLEGLVKGGCETRSSAPHLRQDAHAGCRGKRGAALLVAGFSLENAASAQQLI